MNSELIPITHLCSTLIFPWQLTENFASADVIPKKTFLMHSIHVSLLCCVRCEEMLNPRNPLFLSVALSATAHLIAAPRRQNGDQSLAQLCTPSPACLCQINLAKNFSQVRKCTVISKVTHGGPEPISVFTLSWAQSKAEQLSNQQLSWSVKIGVKGQNEQQGL